MSGNELPVGSEFPGVFVGCDVMAVEEVRDSIDAFGERYLRRVFTDRELSDCAGAPERLAARVAAKEAVVKTFGDLRMATPPREIEVVLEAGLPTVRLHGSVRARGTTVGWVALATSLSHTSCHAMAVVLASRSAVSDRK